jgi:hypothetical protein
LELTPHLETVQNASSLNPKRGCNTADVFGVGTGEIGDCLVAIDASAVSRFE